MKTIRLDPRPDCDLCSTIDRISRPAQYDAKLDLGRGTPWGYVCQAHFDRFALAARTPRAAGLATRIGEAA